MGKKKESSGSGGIWGSAKEQIINKSQNRPPAPVMPTQQFPARYDDMWNNYQNAFNQQFKDYGDIMSGYRGMYGELTGRQPTQFGFERVNAERPGELNEAYGYLREALPGYREFAETGGYSPQDIQELRARGISPIRSAYSGAIRDIDRANTLGGGAANYIAARSRAQRELPGQTADAMTNVNAQLADAIRQGKLAGLGGIAGIGGTMGGLSSAEAGRMLQAALANQGADLQAQGMTEGAYQNWIGNRMGALGAQAGLYGTTPGMSSTFGNQALQAMQMQQQQDQWRQQFELMQRDPRYKNTPWWQTALGTAAPYAAQAIGNKSAKKADGGGGSKWGTALSTGLMIASFFSDKNMKEDISEPIDSKKAIKGLKKLNLHTWKYKGDKTTHFGPMAQDVKKHLGIGDGKTIHLADIAGLMLAVSKEKANAANA